MRGRHKRGFRASGEAITNGRGDAKAPKRLHTHRTFDAEQVGLNEKAPISGAFAEPSDGLEPSTPSPYHMR
jgi:hypothetical protein